MSYAGKVGGSSGAGGAEGFIFGDGSDGDLDLATGTVYTLNRDAYFRRLTLTSQGQFCFLDTNGFRIHVSDFCRMTGGSGYGGFGSSRDVSVGITDDGAWGASNGSSSWGVHGIFLGNPGQGGAGHADGSLRGNAGGGDGGSGNGSPGSTFLASAFGGNGGNGGNGETSAGGNGGIVLSPTSASGSFGLLESTLGWIFGSKNSNATVQQGPVYVVCGGGGGGGGGGGPVFNPGGGGGAGGGVCVVAIRVIEIVVGSLGTVSSNGGTGGYSYQGGGGGGGGGVCLLVTRLIVADSVNTQVRPTNLNLPTGFYANALGGLPGASSVAMEGAMGLSGKLVLIYV